MVTETMERRTALEEELAEAKRLTARREVDYQRTLTTSGETPPSGFHAHGRGRQNAERLWILAREAVPHLEARLAAAKDAETEAERKVMRGNIALSSSKAEVVALAECLFDLVTHDEQVHELKVKRAQLAEMEASRGH